MSACNRCGAEIRWERTAKSGKAIPLDPAPVPSGNVVLRDGRAVVLNERDRDRAILDGATIWRTHFASCPARRQRNGSASREPERRVRVATLDGGLLRRTIALTHPDRHPAERRAEANAVTAALLDLRARAVE